MALQTDIDLGVLARGPKGETGATGPQGPTGKDGAQGPEGPRGQQGERGPQGEQGPAGKGFSITKTYPSVVAMNAGFATDLTDGDFCIIASSNTDPTTDPDNAKLYVRAGDSIKLVTDMSGAQGMKGDQGPQGPRGEQGQQGTEGKQGPQGERGQTGFTYQPYIADDGNWHVKLVNPDGSTN